jgi:hypothetical protein
VYINLLTPVGLEEGIHFAIREGGITVRAGGVTEAVNTQKGCANQFHYLETGVSPGFEISARQI